ncbi:MAG: PspC domain-containing protein [Candidatus Neomarinimicrobiota bacterium]
MKRLYRNTENAKIAGVCAGIADYFDIDPIIVRLIFIISIFWGGGIIAYLVAWFIVPNIRDSEQ